ncbi:hypothetical protein [Williamsia sterculiae]|uniref:Cell wall synthesis protein CwsA n=1 Tax=Williamsia sterculiae TaxID=1344003 RepID=A0A1N7FEX5_9NOCA|nr:hypothetical protein [Williamsia sterculiae]SIR98872.1 hypothetical protein SAMN05445060_2003 [Williamsia sterculiae]
MSSVAASSRTAPVVSAAGKAAKFGARAYLGPWGYLAARVVEHEKKQQKAERRKTAARFAKFGLIGVAVLGAGGATFAIVRRSRRQPPAVAQFPPRVQDVPTRTHADVDSTPSADSTS